MSRPASVLALGFLSLCGCTKTTPPGPVPPTTPTKEKKRAAASRPVKPADKGPLAGRFPGASVPPPGQPFKAEQIVCPPKDQWGTQRCFCLAPYECKQPDCTFKHELSFLRKKIAGEWKGSFIHAEHGSCDRHHYLYMDKGETQGTILVFFSPDGKKIALERTSDYNEFCHKKALRAFFGQIPGCRKMTREGVLVQGRNKKPPLSAIDSLLRLAGSGS